MVTKKSGVKIEYSPLYCISHWINEAICQATPREDNRRSRMKLNSFLYNRSARFVWEKFKDRILKPKGYTLRTMLKWFCMVLISYLPDLISIWLSRKLVTVACDWGNLMRSLIFAPFKHLLVNVENLEVFELLYTFISIMWRIYKSNRIFSWNTTVESD